MDSETKRSIPQDALAEGGAGCRSVRGSVGIITRSKNRHLLLWRAIESVLDQSHDNWVHVIVNDGGEAGPINKLGQYYEPRYRGRLMVIHKSQSVGAVEALNVGVAALSADYVTVHDDDDSWEPEFLTKSIAALTAQKTLVPTIRGVACYAMIIDERIDGRRIVEQARYSFNGWMKTISLVRLAAGNFIPPISVLFEREVFDRIGLFNKNLQQLEDWEFYLRFLSQFEFALIPEHLANWHRRVKAAGMYGNATTQDEQLLFGTVLRNELLRQDLHTGKLGLGFLLALAGRPGGLGVLKHTLWGLRKRVLARVGGRFLTQQFKPIAREAPIQFD